MAGYFWVVDYTRARDDTLHPVVIGGRAFVTELHAQRYIDDASLSRNAEIIELPTSNTSKATQMIKAILARRYRSLDKGMRRAVHR